MSNVVDFKRVPTHTERPFAGKAAAMPFVKWAGGKRSLIPKLATYFPEAIECYWEPFVGGGAVFFTFADRFDRAILSDTNEELVIAYQAIKHNVEAVIEALAEHDAKHRRRAGKRYADGMTYYQRVRATQPDNPIDITARFIYLNKTCFNGLYRVNKAGRFNVPEGSYKDPDICNAERLRRCSQALAKATIRVGDFERVTRPSPGDLVYCDPPYDGTFTGYQASGFADDAQRRLRDTADDWRRTGAKVILSNSDTPAMRRLYTAWDVTAVSAPRNIASKADSRGQAGELVITGG